MENMSVWSFFCAFFQPDPRENTSFETPSKAIRYGKFEDGRDALEALLEAAKKMVGQDRKEYCDTLISKWRTHCNEMSKLDPAEFTKENIAQGNTHIGDMISINTQGDVAI